MQQDGQYFFPALPSQGCLALIQIWVGGDQTRDGKSGSCTAQVLGKFKSVKLVKKVSTIQSLLKVSQRSELRLDYRCSFPLTTETQTAKMRFKKNWKIAFNQKMLNRIASTHSNCRSYIQTVMLRWLNFYILSAYQRITNSCNSVPCIHENCNASKLDNHILAAMQYYVLFTRLTTVRISYLQQQISWISQMHAKYVQLRRCN